MWQQAKLHSSPLQLSCMRGTVALQFDLNTMQGSTRTMLDMDDDGNDQPNNIL